MSLWGRNNGKWASYQIQQNQNRSIYADYTIQQERIAQGCQTINKTSNIASVNSGSVITSLKEGSQDYTCTEKAQCLARASCPAPPPPAPPAPPAPPGPGQAIWANMLTASPSTATLSSSLRAAYTDTSGNVYVTGQFFDNTEQINYPIYDYITTTNNTIELRESTTVPAIDTTRTFSKQIVIKYNKDGIAQWAVNMDIEESSGESIVTDSSGNIYVMNRVFGSITQPIDIYHMDPSGNRVLYGTYQSSVNSSFDILITKYNSNGTAQYVSLCGNVAGIIESTTPSFLLGAPTRIAIDPAGFIIYTFYTSGLINIYNGTQPSTPGGLITFGAGQEFSSIGLEGSQMGIIVRARTSDLQVQQATRITLVAASGNRQIFTTGITIDSSGNIIISGYSNLNVFNIRTIRIYDTDPTVLWGEYSLGVSISGGALNGFILKYNNSLSPMAYTEISSTSSSEQITGIVADSTGNIYAVLYNNTTIPFTIYNFSNVASQIITLTSYTSSTGRGAFLIKYNSNLQVIDNCITTITRPTSIILFTDIIPSGICVDNNDNVYISVQFRNTISVNNAVSSSAGNPINVSLYANIQNVTPILTLSTYTNSALIKYNPQLQVQWVVTLDSGPNLAANIFNINYDAFSNSIYTVGNFNNFSGYLNVNNFNRISGGTLITDLFGKMIPTAIETSTGQTSGFIVKYAA
jgi:hypothetical protein